MSTIRRYGSAGPHVILVHGGPGMAGYLAPVARALSHEFRVLEPFQRESGGEPLTVARHVEDLNEVASTVERPAVVGSSWGAMLALAWAAEHPDIASCLVLIGCGTFDPAAREVFENTVAERTSDVRAQLVELTRTLEDEDERFLRSGELMLPAYSCELASTELEIERVDAQGFEETWSDMLRRQRVGDYPAAFGAIEAPVLMLHGADDPHPGRMIYESLIPHIAHLDYVEWDRCGHYPWLERHARAAFFATLREWIDRHA